MTPGGYHVYEGPRTKCRMCRGKITSGMVVHSYHGYSMRRDDGGWHRSVERSLVAHIYHGTGVIPCWVRDVKFLAERRRALRRRAALSAGAA